MSETTGNLYAIDTATDVVTLDRFIGGRSRGLTVTPGGATIYIANNIPTGVPPYLTRGQIVELSPRCPFSGCRIEADPSGNVIWISGIEVSPDGRYLYVTGGAAFNLGAPTTYDRVIVIDTAINPTVQSPVVSFVSTGFGYRLAVTPDGGELYVPNFRLGTVSVIDTVLARTDPANAVVRAITITPAGDDQLRDILIARVAPPSFSLAVSKVGSGGGTVASSPAGISCGATCSASFASGTSVTLTATPNGTSTFTGWSGACSGTGTCTVTMDASNDIFLNGRTP